MIIREPSGNKILIVLELPDEFEEHYARDRFNDSLERIKCDIVSQACRSGELSGRYEEELIDALIEGFKNSKMFKMEKK